MFLTRMAINASRRGSWKLLRSPQAMHAAVLAGFPPGSSLESPEGRVLWRVDQTKHVVRLYVVSPSRPDLTNIVEQAGWPTQCTWETRDYSGFLSRLTPGQRWRFRLTANPVHAVRMPDGSMKRYGHVTADQQQRWLLDRAETHGFDLDDSEFGPGFGVTRRERRTFRRDSRTVTLDTAQYDGSLRVTDPARLRQALASGIGRAKGYGCGLMTLAPEAAES